MTILTTTLCWFICVIITSTVGLAQINTQNNDQQVNQESIRKGRYTLISIRAGVVNTWLNQLVQFSFSQMVHTKGDALQILLNGTGYQLLNSQTSLDLEKLLAQQLSEHHRQLPVMKYHQALTTIAGQYWDLVVDHINQKVSFELMQPVATALSENQTAALVTGTPNVIGGLTIHVNKGSLKANIKIVCDQFGWTFIDTNKQLDWQYLHDWELTTTTMFDAIRQMTEPWQLSVKFFQADQTVVIDLPEHSRQHQPRLIQ